MEYFSEEYDVIVIGAGHAGIEAGLASARLGCKTAVFTINLDWINIRNFCLSHNKVILQLKRMLHTFGILTPVNLSTKRMNSRTLSKIKHPALQPQLLFQRA